MLLVTRCPSSAPVSPRLGARHLPPKRCTATTICPGIFLEGWARLGLVWYFRPPPSAISEENSSWIKCDRGMLMFLRYSDSVQLTITHTSNICAVGRYEQSEPSHQVVSTVHIPLQRDGSLLDFINRLPIILVVHWKRSWMAIDPQSCRFSHSKPQSLPDTRTYPTIVIEKLSGFSGTLSLAEGGYFDICNCAKWSEHCNTDFRWTDRCKMTDISQRMYEFMRESGLHDGAFLFGDIHIHDRLSSEPTFVSSSHGPLF